MTQQPIQVTETYYLDTPGLGGYVRHRDRMVQESVFQDVRDTLIACRWLAGTTSNPVKDPNTGAWGVLTVADADTLALLEGSPINLIDYFPDTEGDAAAVDDPASSTPLNTFAINTGEAGEYEQLEMGSNAQYQPYLFNMAFYAASDAVALAVLNDLRDRYLGRIVRADVIDLFDYNADPPRFIVSMDVEKFRYTVNTEQVAPYEVHLYFAELQLTDFVDAQ